jgi:apolipoprotein N-acyltransferase
MITRLLFALISGGILFVGFPPFNLSFLTWIALVPLFLANAGRNVLSCFLLGYVCGVVFFLGIFDWILEVQKYTYIHHAFMAFYLGSYVGVFGLMFGIISKKLGLTAGLYAAPFVWVLLEFIRSNFFFMALPWGLLAHSQFQNLPVIQIASVTGTYGISFVIALVNSALAALLMPAVSLIKKAQSDFVKFRMLRGKVTIFGAAVILVTFSLIFGYQKISTPLNGSPMKVSIVQGNIDQRKKWDRKYRKMIMQTYHDLTLVASKDAPDLIIWPETSTPGSVNHSPHIYKYLKATAEEAGTYLLVGSAQRQKFQKSDSDKANFFNSAFLLPPGGGKNKVQHYNKIRLFPFGEYLPLKDIFPWSFIDVSEVRGYVRGNEYTVLELNGTRFAATICWENMFSQMVRKFVENGAQFIVNITNEAWFGETAAPVQFVSMNVFRAVENKIYVVRCANTGISCIIDPFGRVVKRVRDEKGKDVFVRGYFTDEIIPLKSNTFYTRYGDWFAWLCVVVSAIFLLFALLRRSDAF